MYNLAIALGSSVVVFLAGWGASGWIAGIIPAILCLAGMYFVLARRTGKQVEQIFVRAVGLFQAGQLAEGRAAMLEAMPLARWQFLVQEQIYSQLGQVDYQQACGLLLEHKHTRDVAKKALGEEKLREALAQLEKAWSRDWRGQLARALCLHRLNRFDEIAKVMAVAEGAAASEPLYFGIWAWMLNEQKKRDEALQVLGKGLVGCAKSKPLLAMQESLSNKRRPDMEVFGEHWYAFAPDEIPKERLMEMAHAHAQATGKPLPTAPQARRGPPPKTWPMPRR